MIIFLGINNLLKFENDHSSLHASSHGLGRVLLLGTRRDHRWRLPRGLQLMPFCGLHKNRPNLEQDGHAWFFWV